MAQDSVELNWSCPVLTNSFACKVPVQRGLVALNVLDVAFDAVFGRDVGAHHHVALKKKG